MQYRKSRQSLSSTHASYMGVPGSNTGYLYWDISRFPQSCLPNFKKTWRMPYDKGKIKTKHRPKRRKRFHGGVDLDRGLLRHDKLSSKHLQMLLWKWHLHFQTLWCQNPNDHDPKRSMFFDRLIHSPACKGGELLFSSTQRRRRNKNGYDEESVLKRLHSRASSVSWVKKTWFHL
jgi:hypothetical protein